LTPSSYPPIRKLSRKAQKQRRKWAGASCKWKNVLKGMWSKAVSIVYINFSPVTKSFFKKGMITLFFITLHHMLPSKDNLMGIFTPPYTAIVTVPLLLNQNKLCWEKSHPFQYRKTCLKQTGLFILMCIIFWINWSL
jgi:hypothetical protein